MDRINGAGTVDIGGGRRGFRNEDLPTGIEGTEVTDEWLNAVQENILKVIEEAGLALDVNNWSLLWQAIRFSQMSDGYFSVTDQRNDPPAGPAIGDRYIVGGVPTGAWVGHQDEIALWLGAWAFIQPTPWMHVGLADRTDWRWDHTLGVPAWVRWVATKDYAGPQDLYAPVIGGTFSGTIASAQNETKICSGLVALRDEMESTFVGGVLTVAAGEGGMWFVAMTGAVNVSGTSTEGFIRSGGFFGAPGSTYLTGYAGYTTPGNAKGSVAFPVSLDDGDQLFFETRHNSAAGGVTTLVTIDFFRLGGN